MIWDNTFGIDPMSDYEELEQQLKDYGLLNNMEKVEKARKEAKKKREKKAE